MTEKEKQQILKGHTNISFHVENYFLQEKVFNGLNHLSNYDGLAQFDFVPKLIANNEKESIWEWIDGVELNQAEDQDLVQLANHLKKIHNSDLKLAPFLIKKRIVTYRKIYNEKKIKIPIMEKLYRKINLILKNMDKTTPVHGDLWQQNILKTKANQLYLIDWEYSHMGDRHFELAYIIEAFKMTNEQENVFLNAYEDYNPHFLKNHKILVNYLTILWLYTYEKLPFSDQPSINKLIELYEENN